MLLNSLRSYRTLPHMHHARFLGEDVQVYSILKAISLTAFIENQQPKPANIQLN